MMKRFIKIILLIVFAALMLGACSARFEDYADEQILICGLGEDFYITPGELLKMECVSDVAVGQTEKAGTVTAYGPTLETFLEHYGYEIDDIRSVRTLAKDDYTVQLGRATWDNYTVILSVKNGESDALYKKQQPLRLVIPGAKSGKWTYSVIKMEFELN